MSDKLKYGIYKKSTVTNFDATLYIQINLKHCISNT
jgi:hypothetical protein